MGEAHEWERKGIELATACTTSGQAAGRQGQGQVRLCVCALPVAKLQVDGRRASSRGKGARGSPVRFGSGSGSGSGFG